MATRHALSRTAGNRPSRLTVVSQSGPLRLRVRSPSSSPPTSGAKLRVTRPTNSKGVSEKPETALPTSYSRTFAEQLQPDASPASCSGRFSEEEQDALWDSVPRALMKLGKSGAQASHVRSLAELMSAHVLLKVQLNGERSGLEGAAQALAQGSGAELVGIRGGSMLFLRGGVSHEDALAVAEVGSAKQEIWREKRVLQRQERAAEREVVEAKTNIKAKQARSSIGRVIESVSSRSAPMTKDTLRSEWKKIADVIYDEETRGPSKAAAVATGRTSPAAPSPTRPPSKSKAPWRQQAGQ